MKFMIQSKQYVALRNGRVCFDYKSRPCITLSERQFHNLNDIICSIKRLHLRAYPLSDHLWLRVNRGNITLSTSDSYFLFFPDGWKKYIRRIHPVIRFILSHGKRDRYQHDAFHAHRQQAQSRKPSSKARRQTLLRSTRDAASTYEQRTQCTTLPPRDSSNSRSYQPARGRRDATRTATPTSDNHSGTLSDFEYSDQCSIEDTSMSSKHDVE